MSYARVRKGLPFNYNFLNKGATDKYYCAQLVWQAYLNATGLDLDCSGGLAVTPDDIYWSPSVFVVDYSD